MPGLGLPLIQLPPYSPELNPAERVFEEVGRWIEGKVYPSLEDKVAAVQKFLTDLESDPQRVRSLTWWGWIDTDVQVSGPVMRRDQNELVLGSPLVHDLSAPARHPEVISPLVKLSIPQHIVEPDPGFVQPPPPEVPDKEARYSIYSAWRLGPCAHADARATGAPHTVLEGHALLCIYFPREHSRCIALVQGLETSVARSDGLGTALRDTFQTCVAEFSDAGVHGACRLQWKVGDNLGNTAACPHFRVDQKAVSP